MSKERYRDKYGQIWERFDADHVWKPDTGIGGWFNGVGLERIS